MSELHQGLLWAGPRVKECSARAHAVGFPGAQKRYACAYADLRRAHMKLYQELHASTCACCQWSTSIPGRTHTSTVSMIGVQSLGHCNGSYIPDKCAAHAGSFGRNDEHCSSSIRPGSRGAWVPVLSAAPEFLSKGCGP